MSWSYQKQSTWRQQVPLLVPGAGRVMDAATYLASLPLMATVVALLLLLVVAGLVLAAVLAVVLLGPIPVPAVLPSATAATTHVYAADGTMLASWHGAINRQAVSLDQISKYLPAAVVAEEDARYYSNPGVDPRSVLRAAIADIQAGRIVEGGSTITQQYVKDAYVGSKPSLARKLMEARIALKLSRTLSKSEIMNRYLNTVYFGDGAYGAQAAAQTYFGRDASALTISQAALLAGIIHSPDHDSPVQNPAGAEADRLRVIQRMESLGSITHAEAGQARADKPVLAAAAPADANVAWFLDALRTGMIQRYGAAAVYEGGLQIQTTIDPTMQAAAEAAVKTAMPDATDPYAALVAIDPSTGYVRAIVGGRDYAGEKFNIATMGRRQPGSAFKPFVLVAALEQGVSPQAFYNGPSRLCLRGWTPGCVSNFGFESFGAISLTDATVHSVNTVYAQLILQVGADKVAEVARRMGIPAPVDIVPPQVNCRPLGSDICDTYLPAVPSLALGSAGVTPLEMASAYATLAAGGVYRAPKLASQVVDASGKVLDSGPSAPVQAIPAGVAATATQILQQVIVRGTGTAANIEQPAAGKTGTAQDFRNAWFVGYTPTLATSVWLGFRDTNQPLVNIRGVPQVTGGTIPARIWSSYMKVALDTKPPVVSVTAGPADRAMTNQKTPAFSGAASDDDGDVTAVEASVDGGAFSTAGIACTGCGTRKVTWSLQVPGPLGDGIHSFAFRSVDIAGRGSPAVTRTVIIDTVPPTVAGLQATGGATSISVGFSKALACSTLSPSNFSVSVEGRGVRVTGVACEGDAAAKVDLTLAMAPRGGDKVAVSILTLNAGPADQAGNRFAGQPSAEALAANVAPTLAIGGGIGEGALTSNAQPGVQGTATDPDGNVTSVEASVDGGPFTGAGTSCNGCWTGAAIGGNVSWTWRAPARLADGRHTIALQAVDNAGAASTPVTRTVTIDTVPPKASAAQAAGGSAALTVVFSKPLVCSTLVPASFSVSAQGRNAGVTAVSCAGPASATVNLTLAVPPRGGDQVVVTVASFAGGPADQAGNNVGTPRIAVATASNTAPHLEVGGAAEDAPTSNPFPAEQGSAADPDGNVTAVEAGVDGGPFSPAGLSCNGCWTGAPVGGNVSWSWRAPLRLSDGVHSVAVRAVDNAGATSAPVTRTVTIDTVAPKATGLSVSGGSAVVTETFSKPLLCSSLSPADFSAVVAGRRALVSGISCVGSRNDTVGFTLDTAARGGDQVVITAGLAATDVAGNHVGPSRVMNATASNAAPGLEVTSGGPDPAFTSDPRPVWQGSAADPDGTVARVEASLDGGPFNANGFDCTGCSDASAIAAPASWSYRPSRLADGSHMVVIRSVDNAGAASVGVTRTVVVDTTKPALKAVMAAPGSSVVSVIFSKPIACSSVDAGNFGVTVDGAPATLVLASCSGNTDAVVDLALTAALGDGQVVKVTVSHPVTDDAGNRTPAPASLTSPPGLPASQLP